MSAKLRIAGPDDADKTMRLILACHQEAGIETDPATRDEAVAALLDGAVPGAIYLIGPPSSPVGYLSISFGHSISRGTEGHVEELYIRPQIRGRGMASEALMSLSKVLSQHGVRALHIRVEGEPPRFLTRLRFRPDDRATILTRTL